MRSTGHFPYPADEPDQISDLSRGLADVFGGVNDSLSRLGGTGPDLQAVWQSGAGERTFTAVDSLMGSGSQAVTAVANAQGHLDDYATMLCNACSEIDFLNHQWDQNQQLRAQIEATQRAAQHDPAVPAATRLALHDELVDLDAKDAQLQRDHATVMDGVETFALGTGDALNQLAAQQIPPGGIIRSEGGYLVLQLGDRDDRVRVSIAPGTRSFTVDVNGEERQVVLQPGQHLKIEGGGGNDVIDIDPDVELGVWVEAGDGDDVVAGGAGNDKLDGGRGHDVLIGAGGDDMLIGGDGDDKLVDALGLSYAGADDPLISVPANVAPRPGSGHDQASPGTGDNTIGLGVQPNTPKASDQPLGPFLPGTPSQPGVADQPSDTNQTGDTNQPSAQDGAPAGAPDGGPSRPGDPIRTAQDSPPAGAPDGGSSQPGDPSRPAAPSQPAAPSPPREHLVQHGESFWTIAEAEVTRARGGVTPPEHEVRAFWRRLIDFNHDRIPEPGRPDLILAGRTTLMIPPP